MQAKLAISEGVRNERMQSWTSSGKSVKEIIEFESLGFAISVNEGYEMWKMMRRYVCMGFVWRIKIGRCFVGDSWSSCGRVKRLL